MSKTITGKKDLACFVKNFSCQQVLDIASARIVRTVVENQTTAFRKLNSMEAES
jgi:hypothetical protein